MLSHFRVFLFYTFLSWLSVSAKNITIYGDSKCVDEMCIYATVNASTVTYKLQSTGVSSLGWMAMGFGTAMANTTSTGAVMLWPNTDGTITLSQRKLTGEVQPLLNPSPGRVAKLEPSLSSLNASQPYMSFSINATTESIQNVIWAFGKVNPGDSSQSANVAIHSNAGTFKLNLTKVLTTTAPPPPPAVSSSSGLTKQQRLVVAHAVLCFLGYLVLLPLGSLLARYMRTYSNKWFIGHATLQLLISGPIILAGIIVGVVSVPAGSEVSATHKGLGFGLFVMYILQASLGGFIHWVKPKKAGRPTQNYFHVFFGLVIIILAFYQVRNGYETEWPLRTGLGPVPSSVRAFWIVWAIILPIAYFVGMGLLKRQFQQEAEAKRQQTRVSQRFQIPKPMQEQFPHSGKREYDDYW